VTKTESFDVYAKVIECSDSLLDAGVHPLEIAAAHMTHAMKLYRTIMDYDEYKEHMKFILEHKDPEPFQPMTKH